MMPNVSFSKEPIIWVGAAIAVLMLVQDYMSGGIDLESLDAALVALGAVIGRHYVSPVDEE